MSKHSKILGNFSFLVSLNQFLSFTLLALFNSQVMELCRDVPMGAWGASRPHYFKICKKVGQKLAR